MSFKTLDLPLALVVALECTYTQQLVLQGYYYRFYPSMIPKILDRLDQSLDEGRLP
jgi:hypothetical protein